MLFYFLRTALPSKSRKRHLAVQQAVNGLLKSFKRLGAYDGFAVNNETGRALYADLTGDIGLRYDQLCVFATIQALIKGFSIQTQIFGEGF